MPEGKPTATISIERKVSDNNYGSGLVFLSLNGISADTTEEEMEDLLNTTDLGFKHLKARLKKRIAELGL